MLICFCLQGLSSAVNEVSGIQMDPKMLLADAAWCIKNGFAEKWPNATVLMCYFHVAVKVDERLKKDFQDEKIRKMVKEDFHLLQLAQSPEVFQKASKLFINKYEYNRSFVEYFEKEWIKKNPNWFEGAAETTPSTQCGQESTHGKIKQTFTNNERISMNEMKLLVFEIVENFSLDLRNQKPYENKPKVTAKLMEKAYKLVKSKPKIMEDPCEEENETETWWISAKSDRTITTRTIKTAKEMKWKSFDEYKSMNFLAYQIKVDENQSIKVKCSCRDFMKNFQCIHCLAVSINKKYVKVPLDVKQKVNENAQKIQLPNNQKRQRGRPKKAQPALIKQ